MKLLAMLRKQMQVIRNPCHAENLGGFHLHYVGIGARNLPFAGWWKSYLDFYVVNWWEGPKDLPIRIRDKVTMLPPRTALLIKPRVLWEEFFERPFEGRSFFVLFKAHGNRTALDALVRTPGYGLFRDKREIVPALIQKASFIGSTDAGQRWLARVAFLELLTHLHQSPNTENTATREIGPLISNQRLPENEFQRNVFRHLKESPQIEPESMAKLLGLSRSRFNHRFTHEMGESFVHLKNRLRIEQAQELIANTSKQVKEIAAESGFEDSVYFTRVFRKLTGFSPKEYRDLIHR